jgi:hypothetical protein
MVLSEHGERLAGAGDNGRSVGRPKVTLDLTADQIIRYDNLIDRVFDFTFDVLGIGNVELRVREGVYRRSST